jgi:DNA-binding FadR family transcriptional regulator
MTEKELLSYLKEYLLSTQQAAYYDTTDIEMAIKSMVDVEFYEKIVAVDNPFVAELIRGFLSWLKPEWRKNRINGLLNDI